MGKEERHESLTLQFFIFFLLQKFFQVPANFSLLLVDNFLAELFLSGAFVARRHIRNEAKRGENLKVMSKVVSSRRRLENVMIMNEVVVISYVVVVTWNR